MTVRAKFRSIPRASSRAFVGRSWDNRDVIELLRGLRLGSREDGRVVVHGADPRVAISKALLANIADSPAPGVTLSGNVLRIEAVNRTVIYKLGRDTEDGLARLAEWPD